MKRHIFLAKSINGKLDFGSLNEARLRQCVKDNPNKTFRLEMMEPKRSIQQNRYYRLFLEVCERETGQPADDIHEWGKRKFLPPRFININGEEMKIPATTTTLSKNEFGEYLDRLSAEIGVPLPDIREAGFYIN